MDWKNGPCPSDTGLKDWQRLVRNCQISKRLSLNWLVGNGLVDWSEIGAWLALWQWIGCVLAGLVWHFGRSPTVLVPSAYCEMSVRVGIRLALDWSSIGRLVKDWYSTV